MVSPMLLERYARWDSFDVLENANRYPSPSGFLAYVAEKALEIEVPRTLPREVLRAHEEGRIYVHKLPYCIYLPYCCGHDIARLLIKGVRTPVIVSGPAKHLDSFVDHVANYLHTMQHYFTGAQAFSAVELYAGAFIRSDRLDYATVRQQLQRLLFNLNYPSRVGFQTPFTNFTVVLDASKRALGKPAIVGGKPVGRLGDFLDEAKLFFKALCEVLLEGDAEGKPFTFPIPTLMVTSRTLWEDPEIRDLVFRVAAKRGSFYFLNTRVVDPDATFAMCCRLSIQLNELRYANGGGSRLAGADLEQLREERLKAVERGMFGGLWAIPDATGSINVVDVNLPRLALEARGEESRFWELYDETLELVARALTWFRKRYAELIAGFPGVYGMVRDYLPFPDAFFSTIGLIGLPEAAAILMREPRLWFEESRSRWIEAAKLMQRMVERATRFAREMMRETGEPWNVEEVPGESAAPKLAAKDLARFPELAQYLPDAEYPIYSTSIAPYYGVLDLADRILIEAQVQRLFTGGVMMHIFLAEEPDPEALAKLTQRLAQTDLVYWSYTPAITYCPRCGRTYTGLHTACPRCGSEEVEVWSRIVGYYRPLKNWNPARKREFWTRKHYAIR